MGAIDDYLERHAVDSAAHVESAVPSRGLAVVTCMDVRLFADTFPGFGGGEAHILRNAGGIVTEDVIRSLTVSQHLLDTREIMVVQHTDCGMAKYAEDELADRIAETSGERPAFALETFSDLDASVRRSLARIAESPTLVARRARGFVYDVATGRLREVAT